MDFAFEIHFGHVTDFRGYANPYSNRVIDLAAFSQIRQFR